MGEFRVVGKRVPKADAAIKATGEAEYADDLAFPGMLHAKILRSPLPYARVLDVDTSRAEKLRGVKAVVTGKDFPNIKYGFMPSTRDQLPLCRDRVRYVGDEVVAVAAVDGDIAEEALELVRVEYDPLPAVFDPVEAMQDGAPQLHDHVKNNISCETHFHFGDVEKAFRESDYVREDEYSTQGVIHGFVEPHTTTAYWDASGKLTLWASKQSPYIVYRNLARSLDIPPSKVRLILPYVGGGFGGKHEPIAPDFAAAMLSRKTGRHVKIAYDQEETFVAGRRRHPMIIRLKTGVKRDGTVLATACTLIADGGAYCSVGALSIYLAGSFIAMPTKIPNVKYDAYRVYTNKAFAGALRGHAIPQMRFATDQQLDDIAIELGMDPIDLHRKNSYRVGDVSCNGFKVSSCGFQESLDAAEQMSNWKERRGQRIQEGTRVRGVGVACNSLCTGSRLGGHNASAAVIRVHEDGAVSLLTGSTDVGQGAETVLAQILAEELGLNYEEIHVANVDTDVTPLDPGTYGSRVTYTSGNAVRAAAADVREQMFRLLADRLEADPRDLELADHRIQVKGSPQRGISWLEAIRYCYYTRDVPLLGRGTATPGTDMIDFRTGEGNLSAAYSFGTQVAEVEVDTETGRIKLLNMVVAHDSGYAINPMLVEGQHDGSVVSGEAQVLFEDLHEEKGHPLATSFLAYGMPTAMDTPKRIYTKHIESIDPTGPYGAKESGEGTQISTLPAIANAIYDALGVRIKEMPITPAVVLKALEAQRTRGAPQPSPSPFAKDWGEGSPGGAVPPKGESSESNAGEGASR